MSKLKRKDYEELLEPMQEELAATRPIRQRFWILDTFALLSTSLCIIILITCVLSS